ncbi:MAG TPA: NADH-quinone oxidoreductase subunit NuoG [Acidimicrobiales bacterium]|nr:NADH-quinone oxidoreductase subunit NuoG [Acidimicrobiales bacterium]
MADTEQDEAAPTAVSVTINGQVVEARPDELLIAAAERHGTYIPRFCYHPRMRPVGMCRMCIVEVDTGRGPSLQPACMLPVAEGMVVDTESDVTKKAQDGVLEFLLINHPLDCPVCDKGGECPLQDQTLAFGPGESRFIEEKRHFEKPIPLSPLVYMDRERCILCDRCTRFSREVAGDPLISFIDRGNETQVNTFPDDPFASYFSGNTVQICPVGALTAVPYRFKARPWDLDQVESTCTTCAVGCRVAVQSSSNRLVRSLGVDVDPVNHGWLCDKGRFDFEANTGEDRLVAPLIDGAEASWDAALTTAADALQNATVAVLGGARLTNEDAYAWSKLARTVIGTDDVDCQLGDGLPAECVLGLPRATIDEACAADVVVLLTGDIKEELPVLYLRLREAVVDRGLHIVELSAADTGMTRYATTTVRYRPGEAAAAVPEVAGLLTGSVVCVLGRPSLAEPAESITAAAAALLEVAPDARFLSGLRRGNVHGALDMGLAPGLLPGRVSLEAGRVWFAAWGELPETTGRDARGILEAAAAGELQTLVLLGADPLADFPDRELARRALDGAGTVVAVDTHRTASVARAGVVLPAAAYAEKAGTTTNLEGRISRLNQKVTAPGTARPDWMIAVELAYRMGGDLGLESLEEIWAEIERLAPSHAGITRARLHSREGLDGIVVGREPTAPSHPATMAQTEAPEIVAAAEQGETEFTTVVEDTSESAEGEATAPASVAEAAEEVPMDEARPEPHAEAAATEAVVGTEPEADLDASAGGTATAPEPLRWTAGSALPAPTAADSYSLRLVVTRSLYDAGTLVQRSPSLAPLASPRPLQVNPTDLDRLGVASGDEVRVIGSRATLTMPAVADPGVPRGVARLVWNQPDDPAADLLDVSAPVTDVRVETV